MTTRLTITYGRKGGPRSGHIREGRRGVADPSFTVTPGETPALRLNTDVGLRFPPDGLAKLPDHEKKLDYLRFEILGALDLFAQYQRRFLERYFAFIAARWRDAETELSDAVAWSGGLFAPADYVFSALWPLPDARVTGGASEEATPLGDFDFAFWTGRRVVGVTLTGGAVQPPGEASSSGDDRLFPVAIAARDLQDDPALFAEPRFPAELVSFWIGEKIPSSPFRPVGLTDLQAEPA
jgi:hypothetical protein